MIWIRLLVCVAMWAGTTAAWADPVAIPAGSGQTPRIVIVIDDMGLDRARSARAVGLPGPLTLSWLPEARNLIDQTAAARKAGHELMLHLPMEPTGTADPGPLALRVGMSADEIRRRVLVGLNSFPGMVGVNNHMGSRFSADPRGMAIVLREVAARGLLYLDSRTTPHSQAPALVGDYGLPVLTRDVFLDNRDNPAAIRQALAQLERIARTHGVAIAIGHPRDATLKVLAAWLPTLKDRGLRLVPLSAVAGTVLRE